jgi:hypothetical protein
MGRMRNKGRLALIAIIVGAGLLGGGGAITAYDELNPFAAGGTTPASRFAALAEGAFVPGPSLLAKRLLLDTCLEAIAGAYGRLQAAGDRRPVLQHCLDYADAIVGEAPSYAYGWYVGALAAAEMDDVPGFNARLHNAQIIAPAEQWVAGLRVGLLEDHMSDAMDEVRARHESDLRLLVASARGIASIAERYLRDPAFRERIGAIVESMPEADQARFVATVRSVARDRIAP